MEFITELFSAQNFIALITLTALEIILGIDNIVFLVIVVEKLPQAQQAFGRRLGQVLAMVMRIGLLFCVSWLKDLEDPIFTIGGHGLSIHALVLLIGGLFLIAKATYEIHAQLSELTKAHQDQSAAPPIATPPIEETSAGEIPKTSSPHTAFWMVIAQILALDLIFSIDSVITAVGMVDSTPVIVVAVVLAVIVMMLFAEAIGKFVGRNPTIKMLALAFLILIGVALVIEGLEHEFPKGYIYSAMVFSLAVELINLKVIHGMRVKRLLRKRERKRTSAENIDK